MTRSWESPIRLEDNGWQSSSFSLSPNRPPIQHSTPGIREGWLKREGGRAKPHQRLVPPPRTPPVPRTRMTSSPNRPRTSLLKGAATARVCLLAVFVSHELTPLSERRRAQNPPKAKSTSKRAGKPGQSKAKTAGVSSAKAGGKRRRTLSLLPTMPLDVLYEVYAHFILPSDEHSLKDSNCLGQVLGLLSPKDLLNIFRTNTLFKTTLEGSDAKNIWTQARRRFDAPAPPPRFNEPQWARLLFEPKCGVSQRLLIVWSASRPNCASRTVGRVTFTTRIGRYRSDFAALARLHSECCCSVPDVEGNKELTWSYVA